MAGKLPAREKKTGRFKSSKRKSSTSSRARKSKPKGKSSAKPRGRSTTRIPARRKFRRNPSRSQWVKRTPGQKLTDAQKQKDLEQALLDKYGTAFVLQALRDIAEDRGEFFVEKAKQLAKVKEANRTLTEKTYLDIARRKGPAWWQIADLLERAFFLAVNAGLE